MKIQTKKICVVDDDPNVIKLIETRLKEKGFEVFLARDGAEALPVIFREIPDLVISDVMMPNMDGPALAAKLRENLLTKNIPLIFLTSLVEKEEQTDSMHSGCYFIAKPFNPAELLSVVHEVLVKG